MASKPPWPRRFLRGRRELVEPLGQRDVERCDRPPPSRARLRGPGEGSIAADRAGDIRRAKKDHDCKPGEILEGHGKAVGLCYSCLAPAKGIVAGVCQKCRAKHGFSEEELTTWPPRQSSWASRESASS
jgi:hypothetical protein